MMKTPANLNSRRGYALVLVLSFVVLVTGFLVAFLLSATTERAASGGFAASIAARQLGDTAIAMVQGQINDASTQGTDVAWVSQPGMVRTFDDQGRLVNAYKLYSAPSMVSDAVDPAADAPPAGWSSSPAEWVDLNAPVSTSDPVNPGSLIKHFPIVDPAALDSDGEIAGLSPSQADGFELNPNPPGSTGYQPVPMPVRWLYVLEDGKLVSPASSDGKVVTLSGETVANPVVGRVAFWTDDESAKVNINTASEGSFWDTPRGYTDTEVFDLALKQPAAGEYNRFPGHPATVSLSSVLPLEPLLSPLGHPASRAQKDIRHQDLAQRMERYLQLTPRYRFGGSAAGTIKVNTSAVTALEPVQAKGERLYASLDEMIFQPDREENQLVTEKVLESRRFFLTAHSRAPETNLFNLPRIAAWPIHRLSAANVIDTARTNAFDRTIALCASTGAPDQPGYKPYFFQRQMAYDPQNDYNAIERNQHLYAYLQKVTGERIPGFGGDFAAKYGADRDQILTQIFDYIRTTNLHDDALAANMQFTENYYKQPVSARTFASSVTPIQIGDTQGQGRYYGLSQLSIVFLCAADGVDGKNDGVATGSSEAFISNDPASNKMLNQPFPGGPPIPLEVGQKRVQAMIVPTFFSTMIGWQLMRPHMTVEITGLEDLKLEGQELNFPTSGSAEVDVAPHSFEHGVGGYMTVAGYFSMKRTPFPSQMPLSDGVNGGNPVYPFISAPVTVPRDGMKFDGGGPITVRVYTGIGASKRLVQTATVTFPPTNSTIPTPTLKSINNPVTERRWSFFSEGAGVALDKGRLRVGTTGSWNLVLALDPLNQARDVARSMVVKQGDFRLSGASAELDEDMFEEHPHYHSTTIARAIMLGRNDSAEHTLVSDSSIPNYLALPGLKAADLSGDFDNGPAQVHDIGAPGANKPDEGQISRGARNPMPQDSKFGVPYYASVSSQSMDNKTYFSPNRIIPSPVMFGSLPTGVKAGIPWRTLRFRPAASHESVHASLESSFPNTPDHLLLDLFWMPVVEPYAISDRFSTAGKVNMNYQIMPFTYIQRTAPIRAVFASEKVTRIPNAPANNSLDPNITSTAGPTPPATEDWRHDIDVDETLSQFESRFGQTDKDTNVFISASEICDLHMVPEGSSAATMAASWANYRLTGDNLREKIYATVYPKLTTKSNTYTVHFRAQALKKVPGSAPGAWTEGRDQVTGEYRGSTTLERFINSNAEIPDFATTTTGETLDSFYKWRVLSNKQFAP